MFFLNCKLIFLIFFVLEGKVNVNFQDHLQRTPLYLAIIKGGHLEVVRSFIEKSRVDYVNEMFFLDSVHLIDQTQQTDKNKKKSTQ